MLWFTLHSTHLHPFTVKLDLLFLYELKRSSEQQVTKKVDEYLLNQQQGDCGQIIYKS